MWKLFTHLCRRGLEEATRGWQQSAEAAAATSNGCGYGARGDTWGKQARALEHVMHGSRLWVRTLVRSYLSRMHLRPPFHCLPLLSASAAEHAQLPEPVAIKSALLIMQHPK